MRLIRCSVGSTVSNLASEIRCFPEELNHCVAAIGNFDGVHKGHQSIIQMLQKFATQYQLPTMIITFEPMPQEFFLKEKAPQRLTTIREKFKILQGQKIDILCVLRFNAAMACLSALDFIRIVLVKKLRIKHLIVGEDFRFGKGRAGDINLLQSEGQALGLQIWVAPMVLASAQKISSTDIRKAVAQGRIAEAEQWLGRRLNQKVNHEINLEGKKNE
jgi:riboflavin kinase/FMN adenylyltransferase